MSEQSEGEVERGPNGFPYVEMDQSRVAGWQNGEFHLKIERTDCEILRTNFEPEQFRALRDAVDDTLREAANHPSIDYYGGCDDDLTHCVECGKVLDDPKNRGDPDVNGEWVCADADCRELHGAEMTCDGSAELVTDGGRVEGTDGSDRLPYECEDCGKVLEHRGEVLVHAIAVTGDDKHEGGFEF
ncbi:hypothetical protein [Halorubrum ezzemoulense]|uniref:C2H2-type domain-containing protein n=1 Tax=Halorubrum ezzemoulense TaxID=337243 RepID=A0A256J5S4_HALEZ|nr:hypothetical protein [Halorubrum ezzemoulense]OYR64125.1 hypothetical protein DJ80_06095 [Halorubrum ezzemoulense]